MPQDSGKSPGRLTEVESPILKSTRYLRLSSAPLKIATFREGRRLWC
jgi:hypothetical protein